MNGELLGASSEAAFFSSHPELDGLESTAAFTEAAPTAISQIDWEAYLAEAEDIDEQAELAGIGLSTVMSFEEVDGTERTYEDIIRDTNTFFETPAMQANEALMARLTAQLALACLADCALGLAMATNSLTSKLLERGMKELGDHDHDHEAAQSAHSKNKKGEDDDDDDTSSSRRRRSSSYGGWLMRGLARLN